MPMAARRALCLGKMASHETCFFLLSQKMTEAFGSPLKCLVTSGNSSAVITAALRPQGSGHWFSLIRS